MSAASWAVSTLCLFVAMYRAWLGEHRRANAAAERKANSEKLTVCERCKREVPFWFMREGPLPRLPLHERAKATARRFNVSYTDATIMADTSSGPPEFGCLKCAGTSAFYPLLNETEAAFKSRVAALGARSGPWFS